MPAATCRRRNGLPPKPVAEVYFAGQASGTHLSGAMREDMISAFARSAVDSVTQGVIFGSDESASKTRLLTRRVTVGVGLVAIDVGAQIAKARISDDRRHSGASPEAAGDPERRDNVRPR